MFVVSFNFRWKRSLPGSVRVFSRLSQVAIVFHYIVCRVREYTTMMMMKHTPPTELNGPTLVLELSKRIIKVWWIQ
jgi:hypothetical protein